MFKLTYGVINHQWLKATNIQFFDNLHEAIVEWENLIEKTLNNESFQIEITSIAGDNLLEYIRDGYKTVSIGGRLPAKSCKKIENPREAVKFILFLKKEFEKQGK